MESKTYQENEAQQEVLQILENKMDLTVDNLIDSFNLHQTIEYGKQKVTVAGYSIDYNNPRKWIATIFLSNRDQILFEMKKSWFGIRKERWVLK